MIKLTKLRKAFNNRGLKIGTQALRIMEAHLDKELSAIIIKAGEFSKTTGQKVITAKTIEYLLQK